jgi:hypothetical protein
MRSPAWLLVLSFAAACGSGGATPDGGGAPAPDGGGFDAEGGLGDGAVPRDDDPITGRPSRDTHQCRIQRDRTDHSPRNWTVYPPALVKTTGDRTFLARLEFTTDYPVSPLHPPPQLVVSSFDVAGTFGPATTVPLDQPQEGSSVAAAPRADGLLVVWVDAAKLRVAAFDAAGQVVLAPRDLLAGIDAGASPALVAGADGGFGLVYAPQVSPGAREMRFTVLDPDGNIRMAPRTLTAMPGATFASPAASIAATASGYAMIWRDPASMAGGIDFASASFAGAEMVARHRVSAPVGPGLVVGGVGGFEPATTALLPNGDGFVAAWPEDRRGDVGQAGSVVRLVRLDASGNRVGEVASMRRFQADVDEVEPSLVPFGDAVAVLWARGSHTYICAGCVPDHRIDLLLIDPATLAPLSNVVSLTNGGDPRAGGLLRRQVAVVGNSLLVPYLLQFHVHATPGSAVFECTKK